MGRSLQIICDPNPFCYGAISALRALARHLPEASFTVLATGPVREQCDPATFDRVLPCDVKDPASVRQHASVLAAADLYLAVSNNTNIGLVQELKLPLVFVDILFWMKRRMTPAMRQASGYIIENFPGVDEALERYGRGMIAPKIVGPLIASSLLRQHRRATPHLLVNYGGAYSPDIIPGKNTCYPSTMTRLLREVLPLAGLGFEAVTVATGAKAVARIREEGADGGLRVETLAQEQYLAMLASSSQFLTSPGLNAPFEGFALGIPTSFLPPQNLTQVCQLAVYQEHGLAPQGLNLTELYPDHPVDPLVPEAEGTARLLELVARFDADVKARALVRERVVAQLNRSPSELVRQVTAQEVFLRRLGPPGGAAAAEEVRRILAAQPSRQRAHR
ncbi:MULTISPECIES: hypothetical protein [Corallococcus]|uniref:hypothetical protein n=1 Tax=Corallococcus TaxID=83461 RepID=UPI0013158897|nr:MULTISPECIES: hypothetical protein [Corallococcus]